jgi:cysteine desulfuration protein SufE
LITQEPARSFASPPRRETISAAQERIAEEFKSLADSSERYEHLVALGRNLAPMPDALKVDGNHLRDCRGDAWLAGEYSQGILYLHAASNADVVAGLLSIFIEIYSGRFLNDVLDHPLDINRLGLMDCMSPHRLSCFQGIMQRVRNLAMLAHVQAYA